MYTYYTKGVCSSRMEVELDGDKIKAVRIAGGCNGNLQGIIRLVEGMDAREAIRRLRGIHCGPKATSCPDQLSIALEQALAERAKG
ncbi:MAG: TIGR03905 family TSCPD domain-containing protein [Clostridiales bacterium]|nr:TIGR03905 family TSCPD domain-containing protein [Clostridiales bacterium]